MLDKLQEKIKAKNGARRGGMNAGEAPSRAVMTSSQFSTLRRLAAVLRSNLYRPCGASVEPKSL